MRRKEEKERAWERDQLQRALFFHKAFHEYGLIELAERLDQIKGEKYKWDLSNLAISETAWNIAIHRGLKPVLVFCHPDVIMENPKFVAYYRMLAILSQKSMQNIGLPVIDHELKGKALDKEKANKLAVTLNKVISSIIEDDPEITRLELDMLRAMSAGTQADGSWRNRKGDEAENAVKALVKAVIKEKDLLRYVDERDRWVLKDGRVFVFQKDPDIVVYNKEKEKVTAVEIKGGIDPAGVHERYGAALKTLEKVKKETGGKCRTIFVAAEVSLTDAAKQKINESEYMDRFFAIEEVLKNESSVQKEFLTELNL